MGVCEDQEDGAGVAGALRHEDLVNAAWPGPARGRAVPGRPMERPRMKRTLDLVDGPDGEVYVLRPAAEADLRIELDDGTSRELLGALDGSRTVPWRWRCENPWMVSSPYQ